MQRSIWSQSALPFTTASLHNDVSCEVCIVGGGLSGVYTAYLLAKAGIEVVLVEARQIAAGATGLATGKLSSQHDNLYSKLIQQFSKDEASLYFHCQKQAIAQALKLVTDSSINSAHSTLYATTEGGLQSLQQEYEAYQLLGIPGELGNNHELAFQTTGTLTIKDDAQIHPIRFTQQLAQEAIKHGARLFENTRVHTLYPDRQRLATTNGANIQYKKLILCTHYPIESIKKMNLMKLRVERGYLMAAKVSDPLTQQYLSVDQPTRSIRTVTIDNQAYMVIAGASHLAGTNTHTPAYYEALTAELLTTFHLPNADFQWSSQDIETPDLLPYVGPLDDSNSSIYVATGFRKWGLANSLVAGELLLAHLTNNPLVEKEKALYSPNRTAFGKTLAQALQLGSIVISEFVGGHLTRTEAPKCTHLGCKTRWNEADETWDCPCHGSRYKKNGEVLEGPAVFPLEMDE